MSRRHLGGDSVRIRGVWLSEGRLEKRKKLTERKWSTAKGSLLWGREEQTSFHLSLLFSPLPPHLLPQWETVLCTLSLSTGGVTDEASFQSSLEDKEDNLPFRRIWKIVPRRRRMSPWQTYISLSDVASFEAFRWLQLEISFMLLSHYRDTVSETGERSFKVYVSGWYVEPRRMTSYLYWGILESQLWNGTDGVSM